MIRVGLDCKSLLPPRAGVARYVEGLLSGVRSIADSGVEVATLSPPKPCRTLPWVLWNLQRATAQGFDVFHFPFYYLPLAPRCAATVAIHDVLVLTHPEWFPRSRLNALRVMIPRSARMADAVITGAECTAEEIHATCGTPRDRLHVIPYGVDRACFRPQEYSEIQVMKKRLGITRPYLLQLGALEPRRGVDVSVHAHSILRQRFPDVDLLLAGNVRAPVAGLEPPPAGVRRLGWVDESDLGALYAGAAAVLAPSRGEGFDLPILEALACGALVVASDIAVHQEHFTTAVEFFRTDDADALAATVERLLADSARASTFRQAGSQLAWRFTWEACARRHIGVWREVAGR